MSMSICFSTVLLSCPIGIFTGALAMLCGVAIFGYYHTKGCDPLADGAINNPNQVGHLIYLFFFLIYAVCFILFLFYH